MAIAEDTHDDDSPKARLEMDRRLFCVRFISIGLGISLLAVLLGATWSLAGLFSSLVLLAMLVERTAIHFECGRLIQIATGAARIEGQRDAIAQVMSLELAYERSRSVFESLREGVVVVDEVGEIVLANPAARVAMAKPSASVSRRILWDVLTPGLASRARDAFEALRERSDSAEELPQIRYSGIPCSNRVFDLTAVKATSQRTGQDFGTVFLMVDSSRTHELQRIKDRFLSNVSHELRTPLTNICAYSEILSQMLPGESIEWPEFVRVINEESVALSGLVDAMFDFLQLESGEVLFENEILMGSEVVRAVVESRQEAANQRQIAIELCVEEDPVALLLDRARLEQVIRHLLDNAIKFTPDGGIVKVLVAETPQGWELRIEDNGPGVAQEDRQAVFEKFHQLRHQLTDKPSGTGIGLATSRAIVARFGGLIWCEESEMSGASFVVLLPVEGAPRLAEFGAGTGAGGGF